jgi:hypothetical protein
MPATSGFLQRKCACGIHAMGGQCEECKKKKGLLERASLSPRGRGIGGEGQAPPLVHEVLRSPGQPLDAGTRAYMEPRFGHDFSQVRLHTDAKAAESARAVNAIAYTVGRDVVMQPDQQMQSGQSSQLLLAHELAHVVQQGNRKASMPEPIVVNPASDAAEHEAEELARTSVHGGRVPAATPKDLQPVPVVQRKVAVDKAAGKIPNPGGKGVVQTNAKTVENYLTTLCPGGSVSVDGTTGNVGIDKGFCTAPILPTGMAGPPSPSPAQLSKTPTGCGCVCDLVDSKNVWAIRVDDASWPNTVFDDEVAAKGIKPGGTGGTVTTPSPNSPKLWGAATASGKDLDIDPWLVLGHELCGHGWLGNSGLHGPDVAKLRGEGGHQETVARENELRKEHGIDLRGTFKDPNCGESYWRDKSKPGKVNWSSFRSVCEKWRNDYNKKNGTSFKIADKIP